MSMLERANARIASMREQAAEAANTIMQSVAVGGTTFGWGVLAGKSGDGSLNYKVMGVDAELLVGVAAHGLAFANMFGKYDGIVHAVGDASLGVWSFKKGLVVGADWNNSDATGNRQFTASGRMPGGMSASLRQRMAVPAR